MNRITEKQLNLIVDRINKLTNSPNTAYTKTGNEYKANVGNYHLSGAYGGVSLHQMVGEDGGVRDVFGCGHIPKRDLFNLMHAFIHGLENS